ncbi:hypothetical protein FRC04_002040 [Tulasnella sp. 424]|nr:hypothetical protein FRC04_002040 [Tulasnella sp. 424]KAG8968246.1 hypothetical protein FRC05_001627 [Tulasnella sp. 425]
MRVSLFLVTLTAAFASASIIETRALGDFPKCAQVCLINTPKGSCGLTDFKCLCHNGEFIKNSTACINKSCSKSDQAKARAAQAKTCKGK